ncbi:hypothetical protein NMY22_g20019 [Coprinellus aureogranulatus]|nr:hypothetical protein NMY22_g20019 [Coprinellus aureogranulatus]
MSEKTSTTDLQIEDVEKREKDGVQVPAGVPVDAHYDPKFVSRTLRYVDWRILPLLGLLYSIALIDRTNLGMARIAGMEKDLVRAVYRRAI